MSTSGAPAHASGAAPQPQPKHERLPWAAIIATSLALLALFTTLLGYGATLGILDALGLSPVVASSSASDYILLAWPAVLVLVGDLPKDWLWDGVWQLWRQHWYLGLILAVTFWLMWGAGMWHRRHPAAVQAWRSRLAALRGGMGWGQELALGAGLGVVGGLLVYLALAFVWLCMAVGLVFLLLTPILGHTAGVKYARQHVVQPQQCAPLALPTPAKSASGAEAQCVVFTPDDKDRPAVYGHLALQTPSYMVIYQRGSGVTTIIRGLDSGQLSSLDETGLQRLVAAAKPASAAKP